MLTDAFQPDDEGYVRHWVHTGPYLSPYTGSEENEETLRSDILSDVPSAPPAMASLGGPAPEGKTWRFHHPGRNTYLDQGSFHHRLGKLSLYASTLLVSNKSQEVPARLWTANTIDLWQDSEHRTRYSRTGRKKVSSAPTVVLALKSGQNRLMIQLQELAVRDTPFLFALQLLDFAAGLKVAIPGNSAATASLVKASRWLDGLSATTSTVVGLTPQPCPVEVTLDRPTQSQQRSWLAGEKQVSWHEEDVFACRVEARVEGQRLGRSFEIPANLPMSFPGESLENFRTGYLEQIATTPAGEPTQSLFGILARSALGREEKEADEAALRDGLEHVSERLDCADFRLAALLRLHALEWGHPEQRNMIRMTALGFRFWKDEEGNDAMAFGSENHTILFHSCQYLAGALFPEETFSASGRKGTEQRDLGRKRCQEWLDEKHAQGFTEYLSASYSPITAAALLNLADLSDDGGVRTSASTLLDRLLRQLSEHTFDGVTSGPQGRVYRSVLHPHTSASQGLLSFVLGEPVVEAIDPWSSFMATSRTYSPPTDLTALINRQIKRTYHQANQCIQLHKSSHYAMSSVQVDEESPMVAGTRGYQELLWHASLSKDCHVFVNHPGTVSDSGIGRPGYWYGNGIRPAVTQLDSTVFVAYDIPLQHPVSFTHAHWPADTFDEMVVKDGGWYLGRLGNGFVGLWCSEPTKLLSDILINRDLVARSRNVAWICRCADTTEVADLDAFRTSC